MFLEERSVDDVVVEEFRKNKVASYSYTLAKRIKHKFIQGGTAFIQVLKQ